MKNGKNRHGTPDKISTHHSGFHDSLFPCTSLLPSAHCSCTPRLVLPTVPFFLFVERLRLSCHENTPVSRIVSASCIYDLLLYGSIGTYCECRCTSRDGLTLTFDSTFFKRDNLKNNHVRVKCSCMVVFSFYCIYEVG